jgi:hypothetical protein
MKKFILVSLLVSLSNVSYAVESFTGNVTLLEPTYLPNKITFQMNNGDVNCTAGTWLTWNKSSQNKKAVYATLLTALVSGKEVVFHYKLGSGCVGTHLHIK